MPRIINHSSKRQFKRSGLDGKIDYIEFLKNLVKYLEKDYSDNPTHPQLIPYLKKSFSRKTLSEMKAITGSNLKTKKELEKVYSNKIRVKYENDVSPSNGKTR